MSPLQLHVPFAYLLPTPTDLLRHGSSEEERARRLQEAREAEELAARYRQAASSAATLAQMMLDGLDGGAEDSVPRWLRAKFDALGIK